MAETLRIYVSATRDLESERGVIGRAIAGLPVQIGAEIRRYPPEGVPYDTLFELISNVDRVYFLLGQDITAPAGSEWDLAVELERSLVPLRTARKLTPAAQHFLRSTSLLVTPTEWKMFRSEAELSITVSQDLIDYLLRRQDRFGLTVEETLRLQLARRRLQPPVGVDAAPGGSEREGIILDKRPTGDLFGET